MKKQKYLKRTFIIVILSVALILNISPFVQTAASSMGESLHRDRSQQAIPNFENGMYVIVGAFQIPENAVQYAKSLKIASKSPEVKKYEITGLYYVVGYSAGEDLEFARAKRAELRATSQFYDAWILYVGVKLEDLLKKEVEPTPDEIILKQPKEEKVSDEEFVPPPPVPTSDQGTFKYRFNVTNATTLREVPGYIKIVDAARNKVMRSVSTNQTHELIAPDTQTKEIIVLCDIFGFVKDQVVLKIDDPMSSNDKERITQSNGITTIKFELGRHKVGDVLTMYNVYFFNNAAIMKSESKFELNSLLSMLNENDKLKIRIHGHTNGNAAGKIIKLKDDDDNFFEVTSNNIEGQGSAKELSKARAEAIKRWLVSNGIDEKRMELKGWGGKKMIYGKTDTMAGKNVRVEIEILKG